MAKLTRIVKHFGANVVISFNEPTPEEHNKYFSELVKQDTAEDTRAFRARKFDEMMTIESGEDKAKLSEYQKSGWMGAIFEDFSVIKN